MYKVHPWGKATGYSQMGSPLSFNLAHTHTWHSWPVCETTWTAPFPTHMHAPPSKPHPFWTPPPGHFLPPPENLGKVTTPVHSIITPLPSELLLSWTARKIVVSAFERVQTMST
jgi:hypothetical protein